MDKLQMSTKEYLTAGVAVALVVYIAGYVAGDYILAGAASVAIVLSVWLARWFERRTPADKFHFFQLWKIPDPTTRGTLWLISAFDGALYVVGAVAALALTNMAFSRSLDISVSLVPVVAASTMASGTLSGYWRYRRRYEPISETGGLLLRYVGDSDLTFREKCGVALATVGVIIAWYAWMLLYLLWFA